MLEFRKGLRKLMVEKYRSQGELPEQSPGKAALLSEINNLRGQIRRRHTIGELLIGISGSLIALFLGVFFNSILGGVALLLSIYLMILPLSMFLRGFIVDKVAYSGNLVNTDTEEIVNRPTASLMFQKRWNQLLVDNEAIIHKFILVGFIRGEFPIDYSRGEQIWEEVILGDKTLEEAMDDLVNEHFDEESVEHKYVRGILRQFLGV